MQNEQTNAPPQKVGANKILIIIISSIILIVSILGIGFSLNNFIFSKSTTVQKVDTKQLEKDSKELNDKMFNFVQDFIDKGETKSWNIDKSGKNPYLVKTQISNNYNIILAEMKKTQQNAKFFRSDNENISEYTNLIEVANKVIELGYDKVINLIEYKLLPTDFKNFMKSLDDYYRPLDKVANTNLKTKTSFSKLNYNN